MGLNVSIAILLLLIYWDLYRIRVNLTPCFAQTFFKGDKIDQLVLVLVAALLVFNFQDPVNTALICLTTVIPFYLSKRLKLLDLYTKDRPGDPLADRELLLGDAFFLTIFWSYLMIVFSLVLEVLFADLGPDDELSALICSALFSFALALFLVARATKRFTLPKGFLADLGFNVEGRFLPPIIITAAAIGILLAYFSSSIVLTRQDHPITPLSEVIAAADSPLAITIFLLLAVLVAPLVEEVVFRGYYYHVISTIKGKAFAVISISLVFALLHVSQYWQDWTAIMMITVMGFALTLLRALSGTTLASVVTHYCYNAGVVIIPVIMIALTNPPYFEYMVQYDQMNAMTKERLLKESISLKPNFVQAYDELARLYCDENRNFDEALRLIDQALAHDPQNNDYLDTKAEILKRSDRTQEAITIRHQLLEEEGDSRQKDKKLQRLKNWTGI